MAVLNHLEPQRVFRFFEELCAIPHGSGNTKAVSDWLVDFAKARGLRYVQDQLNNVVIFRDATPGYESAEPVILQGHMDMVCEKEPGCTKDMAAEGLDYSDVLADAQRLGYAEADPTADVDGFDAASKIAILGSIGFRTRITTDDVYMQGIRDITSEDIAVARDMGYVIKLLAIARNTDEGVDVRVHPAMIPATHQLAAVNGAMNAVFVVGDAVGETMFYGAGAGSFPTASAVVGDVLSLSEHISRGTAPMAEPEPFGRNLSIRDIEDLSTNYYIRLKVADRVGALAETVDAFASKNISIKQVMQLDGGNEDSCSVVFLTHTCSERDVRAAIDALKGASCLQKIGSVIRIEDVDAWSDGVMDN